MWNQATYVQCGMLKNLDLYSGKCVHFIWALTYKAEFGVTQWRHPWPYHHRKYLFCDDLWRSFLMWCQNYLILNISNFRNGHHCENQVSFLIGSCTEGWVWRWDSQYPRFWAFARRSSFNINGVMVILKLDLLFNLVTYLFSNIAITTSYISLLVSSW